MNLATIAGFPAFQVAQSWDGDHAFPTPYNFHSSFQGSYIRIFNTKIGNEEQYNLVRDYQRQIEEAGHRIVSFCEHFPFLIVIAT